MATTFNGKTINFDPHDWKGMRELCNRANEFKVPWSGTNEDGEHIMISVNEDNITVETFQKNGWLRENVYWVDNFIVEELFHK